MVKLKLKLPKRPSPSERKANRSRMLREGMKAAAETFVFAGGMTHYGRGYRTARAGTALVRKGSPGVFRGARPSMIMRGARKISRGHKRMSRGKWIAAGAVGSHYLVE